MNEYGKRGTVLDDEKRKKLTKAARVVVASNFFNLHESLLKRGYAIDELKKMYFETMNKEKYVYFDEKIYMFKLEDTGEEVNLRDRIISDIKESSKDIGVVFDETKPFLLIPQDDQYFHNGDYGQYERDFTMLYTSEKDGESIIKVFQVTIVVNPYDERDIYACLKNGEYMYKYSYCDHYHQSFTNFLFRCSSSCLESMEEVFGYNIVIKSLNLDDS